MRWTPYTTARRTDELRGRDERAPIDWAWFCRCGLWTYHRRRHDRPSVDEQR
jgi:hypothetical protein